MRQRIRDLLDRRAEVADLRDQVVRLTNKLAATRLALSVTLDAGVRAQSEADEYKRWWEFACDERDAARDIARRNHQALKALDATALAAFGHLEAAVNEDPSSWGER